MKDIKIKTERKKTGRREDKKKAWMKTERREKKR